MSKELRRMMMAKFYGQSGNFRLAVSAEDAERAALWIVHQAMSQVTPVYEDCELTPEQKEQVALANGLLVLGNTVQLSEVGFDRQDAVEFDTFDLMVQWHQLMIAVARFEQWTTPPDRDPSSVCGSQTAAATL
jgi:hypothetical protein